MDRYVEKVIRISFIDLIFIKVIFQIILSNIFEKFKSLNIQVNIFIFISIPKNQYTNFYLYRLNLGNRNSSVK